VADLAVFVVSAVDGVQVQTEVIWQMAAELGVPRMIFVNKLDRERADFDATLAQLRDRLGAGIVPLELPIGVEADLRGVVDLLSDRAYLYDDGEQRTEAVPEDMRDPARQAHDDLVEGIVVADDELLERYLDGDVPGVEQLQATLHDSVAAGSVFPVVAGSAITDVG